MKKQLLVYTAVLFLLSSFMFSSCKKDPQEEDKGKMNTSIVPLAGETVDVNGLKIQLHKNATYTDLYMEVLSTGTSTSASAEFLNIEEGTYFLVAWKDNDGNADFSTGDYFGFYPSAINVTAGDDLSYSIQVYEVD